MKTTIRKSILMAVAGLFLSSAPGFCQDTLKLIPIEPIPSALKVKTPSPEATAQGRSVSYRHGIIDRIGEDGIVISDTLRQFSRSVECFSASGSSISTQVLKVGQSVDYKLGDGNQVTEIRVVNN